MARPALPEDRRRDYRLQVRLSEGERRTIEYAAQRCKVPVGTLMRDTAMAAIEEWLQGLDDSEKPQQPSS